MLQLFNHKTSRDQLHQLRTYRLCLIRQTEKGCGVKFGPDFSILHAFQPRTCDKNHSYEFNDGTNKGNFSVQTIQQEVGILLLAPKVLLDYLRSMITIHPKKLYENDLSIGDVS